MNRFPSSQYGLFCLQHPAILEQRRIKLAPAPPQPIIPQTILPEPELPSSKKINHTVKKKSKEIKVEIMEQPKEEEIMTTAKKRTRTIKNKVTAIQELPKEEIIDLSKKISTINIRPQVQENSVA